MAALIENGITLPDPTHARIGYRDAITSVSASSAASDAPADAAMGWATYERWRPTASPATLTATFDAQPIDYIGIGAHTLSESTGLTFEVQVGGSWETVLPSVIEGMEAPDNEAIMLLMERRENCTGVRVTFSYSGDAPTIGKLAAGLALTMHRPFYGGHTPAPLTSDTVRRPNTSEAGEWLGSSVVRQGRSTSMEWQHLPAKWYRFYFAPLVEHAKRFPFFVAWNPKRFSDCIYAQATDDIAPYNMGIRDLMAVSMPVKVYSDGTEPYLSRFLMDDVVTWVWVRQQALFMDAAGTDEVEAPGDPVGKILDISGNEIHWTQEVNADRPVYGLVGGRESITFGQFGRQLEIEFTASHTGTMIICTGWGTYWLDISVDPGTYTYGRWERMPIEEVIIMDRILTASEKEAFIGFLVADENRQRKPFMGRIGDFSSSLENQWRGRVDIVNFPLLDFGGVTSMGAAFRGGNAGQWLFPGFLDSAVDVTIFSSTFRSNNLTSIPAGLFDNNPNVTTFNDTFRENQITSIPAGLFDNCTSVTNFQQTFTINQLTSIPDGLFDNNPNVTNFYGTFRENQLTSIPEGLFDNCPNVTSFWTTFFGNQITSIPPGLFDNNPNVTSFSFAFQSNQITSIPSGLFDNCPNVTSFGRAFQGNQLTTAPPNLFDTQTQCTDYERCFSINALTQESVDNILVSIAFSADQNDLDGGILGIDEGTNATPGPAGQAAADALRARGWTVNLNGY